MRDLKNIFTKSYRPSSIFKKQIYCIFSYNLNGVKVYFIYILNKKKIQQQKQNNTKHFDYFNRLAAITFIFPFSIYPAIGVQPPVNMMTQGFAGMNLGMQAAPAMVRPPTNTMMGGMNMGMQPGMTGSTMPTMGGMPVNQGMMGMNMNMGMSTAQMGMPGGMGMGMGMPVMGMNPAMGQPKQDAFADFANFGK